jgi:hypothetical protein
MPIGPKKRYNFPCYVTKNTGDKMIIRMEKWILWAKKEGYQFGLTRDFIESI